MSGDPQSSPGVLERILQAFVKLTLSMPVPARIVVIVAALLIAGGVLAYHFRPVPTPVPAQVLSTTAVSNLAPAPTVLIQNSTQLYGSGGQAEPDHPGADSKSTQNVEAGHKAEEDIAAYTFHFNGQAQIPPEQSIGTDVDVDNYLHYRYFETTDKCLYVNRKEGGVNHYQWLRDPNYHKHDVDKVRSASLPQPSGSTVSSSANNPAQRILEAMVPTAQASEQTYLPLQSPAEPVQANYCVNPHPGTFRYWWGPPVDACNSPMYRQFGDGCIHYQLYNR